MKASRFRSCLLLCLVVGSLLVGAGPLCAQTEGVANAAAPTTYLQPGDLLRIAVWREPDLSGEFIIDPGGRATIPIIGDIRVTDIPVTQVPDSITTLLRREIRNPSINVIPLRRIFVLGDVARPGLYNVPPTTSLAGAVALAGGPSPIGDINKLSVFRDGAQLIDDVAMEAAVAVVDIRSGDQIYVGRTSWISRNVPYLVGVGFTVLGFVMQFVR